MFDDVLTLFAAELDSCAQPLWPYEPNERLVWAFQTALRSSGAAADVEAIIQKAKDDKAAFVRGVASGVGDAINDFVKSQVTAVQSAIISILRFYSLVFDPGMLAALLQTWGADPGSGIGPATTYLQQNYPDLYASMTAFKEFATDVQKIAAVILDSTTADPNPWTKGDAALATWAARLSPAAGQLLSDTVGDLASASAEEAGTALAKVLTPLIIIAVLTALGLYALVRAMVAGASAATAVVEDSRAALEAQQLLSQVLAAATKDPSTAVPGISDAASSVKQLEAEAIKIYQDCAWRLRPHRANTNIAGLFNDNVSDITGYSKYGKDYSKLRLDSHHIVKQSWYDRFAADFKAKFGWSGRDDMDSVIIHTEWHIRSGVRLAEETPPLLGAEKEPSLTGALEDHLRNWENTKGKISSLKDLFDAHESFYSSAGPNGGPYSERLWSGSLNTPEAGTNWWPDQPNAIVNLKTWFAAAKSKL